jgi:hypothetical protein
VAKRLSHRFYEFLKIPEGIRIPFFGAKWYWFITKLENRYIRNIQIKDYPLNTYPRKQKIIVSLTTFPARIEVVHYAIKSLMLQTYKPDRIILWLAENQFSKNTLPPILNELTKLGLEIRYCPDLKSHKKYFYAMKERGGDLLITYDDDIIYAPDSIERLMKYHKQYPDCIICNRGFEILFDNNGNIQSARKWRIITNEGVKNPSNKIMASTGGGCLYPPNSVSNTVFNWEYIHDCALTSDDIWMKAMELLGRTKVVKTSKYHKTFSLIENSQKEHLAELNDIQGQNDVTVNKLLCLFPTLFDEVKKLK